jgi:hypothetical protein
MSIDYVDDYAAVLHGKCKRGHFCFDSTAALLSFSAVWADRLRATRPQATMLLAIGYGVVYIGSRADSKICVTGAGTLRLGDRIAFAPFSVEAFRRLSSNVLPVDVIRPDLFTQSGRMHSPRVICASFS